MLALVLAVLTVTLAGAPSSPAGELSFQTTRSLAHGSLTLGETPEAALLVRAAEDALPLRGGAATTGLAHAALGVPLYAVGWGLGRVLPTFEERHAASVDAGPASELFPHLLVGWRNPLLCAATAWLLVLACRRMGVGRRSAWLAGLSYALTTFAWPAARSGASEVTGAFLLFAAFHLVLLVRERFDRLDLPSASSLVGIGAALGLAWCTHAALRPAVLVLAATAEVVLAQGHRQLRTSRWSPPGRGRPRVGASLLLVFVPLALGVLLQALLDQARFGSWLDPAGLLSATGPGAGALELLVSPGRGLLLTAPLVLLAPLGLWSCWREGERLYPRVLGLLTLAVLLPVVLLRDPAGRWTFGPRPLLPLLPLLWVGVGIGLHGLAGRRILARVAFVLALLGFVVQLPAALVDESTYVDLTEQAGVLAWGSEAVAEDDELWERAAWAPSFAAPWVHWRVLRRRIAGHGEGYPAREIFHVDDEVVLTPRGERARAFRRLAWVDLGQRLGASILPGLLLVLALFVAGVALATQGLDPGRD